MAKLKGVAWIGLCRGLLVSLQKCMDVLTPISDQNDNKLLEGFPFSKMNG